jgi:hypothetical protein
MTLANRSIWLPTDKIKMVRTNVRPTNMAVRLSNVKIASYLFIEEADIMLNDQTLQNVGIIQ